MNLKNESQMLDLDAKKEIFKLLNALIQTKKSIRVWQNLESIHRFHYGQVTDVMKGTNQVFLKPVEGEKFTFLKSDVIYFHSAHRTMLFKTTVVENSEEILNLALPKFVKIEEGRRFQRKTFSENSSHLVSIEIEGTGQKFVTKVIDLSEDGICLLVPLEVSGLVKEFSEVKLIESSLKEIQGKTFIVRHKSPVKDVLGQSGALRIGLELLS